MLNDTFSKMFLRENDGGTPLFSKRTWKLDDGNVEVLILVLHLNLSKSKGRRGSYSIWIYVAKPTYVQKIVFPRELSLFRQNDKKFTVHFLE